jgi:hypothetical protein
VKKVEEGKGREESIIAYSSCSSCPRSVDGRRREKEREGKKVKERKVEARKGRQER